MIHDIIPYSLEKNLGKAYNDAFKLIPDSDHICFRDADTAWLTHDYYTHISKYVDLYPNDVLTCWVSRINERAEQQYPGTHNETDMREHLKTAEAVKKDLYKVSLLHGFISGTCMIIPKKVWLQHKFTEVQVYEDRGPFNLLGVDNDFTNRIRKAGIKILRMDGIYIYHTYRMLTNSKDHLL